MGNSPPPAAPTGRLKYVLRALNSRNYRLFFSGQLVSLIGTWLAQVAMSWLVYDLTHSEILLGVVAFSSQIPAFLLSPWAGVIIDRWNLHRVLIVTQTLSMLQSFAVAALALSGVITTTHIILLAIAQGMINAVDMPARQSFVIHMVERREDLPNAIALNSTMFNMSRLIGPAAAGVLIGIIGTGKCFLLDGISYLAVIIALLAMHVTRPARQRDAKPLLAEWSEGFNYVKSSFPIRSILVQVALVSLLSTPYTVLLPVFARDIYHGDPTTLGLLTSSIGCGAFIGGVRLATRRSVLGLGKWIAIGALIMGVSLILFSISTSVILGMICLFFCGFAQITQMASGNTVVQTVVDDDKRGRTMAFHAMAFQGTMPLGSLGGGALATTAVGATGTVALSGIGCILAGTWFAIHLRKLRSATLPIYQQRGVLPPIATGLETAEAQAEDHTVAG